MFYYFCNKNVKNIDTTNRKDVSIIIMEFKKIICYGDSNTFGFNPKDGSRFDENTRWSGILKSKLAEEYEVLEAGANNRTGFVNNPAGELYSAQKHFPKLIAKQKDFELLILAIGTNDLQFLFNANFDNIENGLENLIKIAKTKTKRIIIVPSVILDNNILSHGFKSQFDKASIEKSKTIGKIYIKIANKYNCEIFDFNNFVKPSELDGLHYTPESHKIIAEKLIEFIKHGEKN